MIHDLEGRTLTMDEVYQCFDKDVDRIACDIWATRKLFDFYNGSLLLVDDVVRPVILNHENGTGVVVYTGEGDLSFIGKDGSILSTITNYSRTT